jgi:uncharacterized protein
MKILFHIAHPAQYHMYKYTIKNLQKYGHDITVTINTKDILEELMKKEGIKYENILPRRRKKNNRISALITLLKKDLKIFNLQLLYRFDMLVGTETALSHIGWLFRKPVLIMDEDDVHVVPEAAKLSFPFASYIISPESCNLGKYTRKKIAYEGYQKTCYLHPKYFKPNRKIIEKIVGKHNRYFLIRVSGMNAYHDIHNTGFSVEILKNIIAKLKSKGKVFISSEKDLPTDFNSYMLNSDVSEIHHFLYFADIFIADSQSMCVEAAILGTPSIRYSEFSGKIGVLEELEHKYDLTYGFRAKEIDKLHEKLDQLASMENIRQEWQKKRKIMLMDKIDVTAFWTWLIHNFPSSVAKMKNEPNCSNQFKENK